MVNLSLSICNFYQLSLLLPTSDGQAIILCGKKLVEQQMHFGVHIDREGLWIVRLPPGSPCKWPKSGLEKGGCRRVCLSAVRSTQRVTQPPFVPVGFWRPEGPLERGVFSFVSFSLDKHNYVWNVIELP
jgi:hypothetical protein